MSSKAHWQQRHEADRKSTRLNSSHSSISYAVFCLKKKNEGLTLTRTAGAQGRLLPTRGCVSSQRAELHRQSRAHVIRPWCTPQYLFFFFFERTGPPRNSPPSPPPPLPG